MNDRRREWPAAVRTHLETRYGALHGASLLGGASRARVWRLHLGERSFVLKATPRRREFAFYRETARLLEQEGVPIPRLEWAYRGTGRYWLLLEDVPMALERERWTADPAVLSVLARLHRARLRHRPADVFRPAWSPRMTAAVLDLFPEAARAALHVRLEALRASARSLLAPSCWVSGDPNPTNWGVRRDGTVVLFDWERFGLGHPALDLAITIPGLGGESDFHRVAVEYLGHAPPDGPRRTAARLGNDIAVAKVWNVVDFLSAVRSGAARDGLDIAWIVEALPGWLAQVAANLD